MSIFTKSRVALIDDFIEDVIKRQALKGAVVLLGQGSDVCLHKAYGVRTDIGQAERMTVDTLFDVASITKIIAMWPVMMRMLENAHFRLSDTLADISPYPVHASIAGATLLQVMTHSAGLPERTWARQYGEGIAQVVQGMLMTRACYTPGTDVRYCSRGPIILGHLAQLKMGMPFAQIAAGIWQEMGMTDTYASPVPPSALHRCAPTERRPDGTMVRGWVHDENAEWLGGMAGHAGAFSTALDLSRFCQMVLGHGELDGRQILHSESVAQSLTMRTPPDCSRRGLLWNIGSLPGSEDGLLYDHLGFTGVGLWLEPKSQTYALLLTNYIHPERRPPAQTIKPIRDAFKALCWAP